MYMANNSCISDQCYPPLYVYCTVHVRGSPMQKLGVDDVLGQPLGSFSNFDHLAHVRLHSV